MLRLISEVRKTNHLDNEDNGTCLLLTEHMIASVWSRILAKVVASLVCCLAFAGYLRKRALPVSYSVAVES